MGSNGGELALIRDIRDRAGSGRGAVRLGIGDDCAVLRVSPGHEVVVTTDFSLEERHFRRDLHPGRSVGHRCLTRGLSDLAAMGAFPLAAFLSLAVPPELRSRPSGRRWLDEFLAGLLDLARHSRIPLAGGDTSAAPAGQLLADIVCLGTVPAGTALRRDRARAGDVLYVTGRLGGAAAEFAALEKRPRSFARAAAGDDHPHLFPTARLRTGSLLRSRRLATAAIDLSDGLSTDLSHLCQASGVGAVVDGAALPIHPLAEGRQELALHGGEDYELLFTCRPTAPVPRSLGGVRLQPIGRITRSRSIRLRDREGTEHPLPAGGWEHSL